MFNDCKTEYYQSSSRSVLKREIRLIGARSDKNDNIFYLWIFEIRMTLFWIEIGKK